MKVIKEKRFYKIYEYCSQCGLELYKETQQVGLLLFRKTILRDNSIPKYCPHCGTKVKWMISPIWLSLMLIIMACILYNWYDDE